MITNEELIEVGFPEGWQTLNPSIISQFKNISQEVFNLSFGTDAKEKILLTYIPEMDIVKVGSKGLLVSHRGLDFDIFYANGNPRYTRFGITMRFYLEDASPVDWAVKVFQDTIESRGGEKVYYEIQNEVSDGWTDRYIELLVSTVPVNTEDVTSDSYARVNGRNTGYFRLLDLAKEGKAHYGISESDIIWYPSLFDRSVYTPIAGKLLKEMSRVWKSLDPSQEGYVKKCQKCTASIVSNYDNPLCPKCFDEYVKCENCDTWIKESDAVFNKATLCKECSKLSSCQMCGSKITSKDENICKSCTYTLSSNKRLQYHSRNNNGTDYGRTDLSNGSRFKCGLEIEKEDATVLGKTDLLYLAKRGWISERDGSLSESSGFELVSPIYPLDPEFIVKQMADIREYIDAKVTKKCGGHIHVSDTQRTPFEILNDIQGYLPLLYMLYPERATNSYCLATEVRYYLNNIGGHHQAINPNGKTLEFRIFPAVKNIESVMFRLSLVKHMMENPRELSVEVGKELLNNESKLFSVLASVLKPSNIKKKAEAFVDLANYIDKEGLVFNGNDIDMPRLNQYKEKDRQEVREKIEKLKKQFPIAVPRALQKKKYLVRERYGKFASTYSEQSDIVGGLEQRMRGIGDFSPQFRTNFAQAFNIEDVVSYDETGE